MPSTTERTLSKRLLDGAAMLGRLWKRGQRCVRAWNIEPPGDAPENPCGCTPETEFCKARRLWLSLAVENGQKITAGDFGLAHTMKPEQLDATQLTFTFPVDGVPVKVGQKGMMSAVHFDQIMRDGDSARSILALLKAFPKARVEGIVESTSI